MDGLLVVNLAVWTALKSVEMKVTWWVELLVDMKDGMMAVLMVDT